MLWKQAKEKTNFTGTMDNFLDTLNNIRIAAILEANEKKRGAVKTIYKLEKMTPDEQILAQALNLEKYDSNRSKLSGVGVYN